MIKSPGRRDARLYLEVERCEPSEDGDDATGIVRAEGELDLETAKQLEDTLDPGLWPGCDGVLVDLQKVSFIDSTGIATLVAAARALQRAGARFAIAAAPRSQVEGLLELTGLRARIPNAL
jgi:anti-anti-sigma factor